MVRRFIDFLFNDMPSLSMGRLMVKGFTWLFIGVVFGRLSIFITRIVAARILGTVPLGEFGLIDSTVNMFVGYAGLGMIVAVSKNLAESCQVDPQRAGRILTTVCLISGSLFVALLLAFFIFSRKLGASLSPNPGFISSMRLGMLLSLQLPAGLATAILNAFQSFRQVTFANIIQGFSTLILTVLLAPALGLNGVVLSFGCGLVLMFLYQVVIIFSLCRKYHIKLKLRGLKQELPLLWRYNLPAVLGGVLAGPVTWGTRAFLAKQPGGLDQLGLYVAAFSLCSVLITISALLSNVTIPVLSAARREDEKRHGMQRTIFLYWLAALGLCIPMVSLANLVVNVLLGPAFSKAGLVLAILVVAVGVRIFYTSFGAILIVIDRVWQMSLSSVVGDPLFLGVTLFLAPLWGAKGLALAYLSSSLVVLLLLYRASTREMGWGRLPYLGLILTAVSLGSAWLIRGIGNIWLALCSTLLLLSLLATAALFLAVRYNLLGGLAARVPILMRNRFAK